MMHTFLIFVLAPAALWAVTHRIRFLYDSKTLIFRGYSLRKTFTVLRWIDRILIVRDLKDIEQIHHLPDDVLSLEEAAKDEMQLVHTLGKAIYENPYHLQVVSGNLTRHIDHLTTEVLDEIVPAFEERIQTFKSESGDWFEWDANAVITDVLTRTFNRIIVGLPTCREPNYTVICRRNSVGVYVSSFLINLFPPWLRGVAGKLLGRAKYFQTQALRYLESVIKQRMDFLREFGDSWPDEPNDVLSWLMKAAVNEENEYEARALVARILTISSATTHTSSYTCTQAVLNLAEHSEYQERLTDEAEHSLRTHGWSRQCLDSLPHIDSFLKESIRINGLASMSFPRRAVQDFELSDGTRVTKHTLVSAPFAVHFDPDYYEDPERFVPLRFLDHNKARVSNGMVTTSAKYLPFGHGRHACPGRFILGYAIKALVVHILTNYEIRLGGEGKRLPDFWFSYHCTPNRKSMVSLRSKSC